MIRTLIAEDMRMLRRALVELVSMEADIEVVAELETGADVVARAEEVKPDVAVLDIDLPGLDGISAAAELFRRGVPCRTLILTSLAKPNNLRRALDAHVSGFLLKDAEPDLLAQTIRAVAAGQRVFDPQLTLDALNFAGSPLTARETDVIRMAADGEDVREIARAMHLSLGTVRNYLTTVVHKLGARNRVDAIRIARASGWL
ncbi:response regulator transcription factor [Streptomyces sp. DSM 42041]|uniref:Response regulator transcription factor n=1 Tax=Streptomyces hazeniae TaxID=3075538 RepID=A0ABU2NN79_9ACTN|nr:response regulator transcription factor [Streptomyces sp. DSM 42041]MDT0378432.1 response regulator transcription factor [Streptomyces sp. DSM 42041]